MKLLPTVSLKAARNTQDWLLGGRLLTLVSAGVARLPARGQHIAGILGAFSLCSPGSAAIIAINALPPARHTTCQLC